MSRKKLAISLLGVFMIAQIPFAVVGLTLIFGIFGQGPEYLLKVYDSLATKGHATPLSRIIIERLPEGLEIRQVPQDESKPEALTTGQAMERQETGEIAPLQELPPPTPDPAQLERRIADLPDYDPLSTFGIRIADIDGLAVDYVSVPDRPSRIADADTPIRIRFGRLEGPRVLLLAGRPGLSWQFDGDLPTQVAAVLVAGPDATGEEMLFGLSEAVPVARLRERGKKLPFLLSALPDCRTSRDPERPFSCSNLVYDRTSSQYQTPFQIAESHVNVLLGADIASVSAAFADAEDRMVLVPEEIVDDTVRTRASNSLRRYAEVLEAERRRKEILKDYARRWVEDRRSAVFDEIARHRPYAPAQLAGAQPRVVVVSAYRGTAKKRGEQLTAGQVSSYEEFVEWQAGEVGSILVEVMSREPTVIIATAYQAVDWRFAFSSGRNVLAVHVEGHKAPTVSGVPPGIPLTVRSRAYGDRNVAGRVRILTGKERDNSETRSIRASLDRFQQMYPGSPMVIYERSKLDRVIVTDQAIEGQRGHN